MHDGKAVAGGNFDALIGSGFFAFDGSDAQTLRNGVYLTAGDLNGDGFSDLVVGGGPGGGPRVLALDGRRLAAGDVAGAFAAPVANFFVGDGADRGGVRVTAVDADRDGRADLVAEPGDATLARLYRGRGFTGPGEPADFEDLDPAAGAPPAG
jgi:hypothetical protein